MYLNQKIIKEALDNLKSFHQFYGITFLACKLGKLPVGETIEFDINNKETLLLERYFKTESKSKWFYRVFRISDSKKLWLKYDYASSGSQSVRTRGEFSKAFLHEKKSDIWGWADNYIDILKNNLKNARKIPAFFLAVWFFKDRNWPIGTKSKDIVHCFVEEFDIYIEEQDLFDLTSPDLTTEDLFQDNKISIKELRSLTGLPPDFKAEEGSTLSYLKMEGVGPTKTLEFVPSERLNLITGDNGVGKSFILECAWWALSGQWAGFPALPKNNLKIKPSITFQLSGDFKKTSLNYDWATQSWSTLKKPIMPGLLIYARVDGSFAVWDPTKTQVLNKIINTNNNSEPNEPLIFKNDDLWEGLEKKGRDGRLRSICNGLLRDWITWQNKPEKYPFETFKEVLKHLSPPDLGPLIPGDSIRFSSDSREIPTIKHNLEEVPILYASAGIRRIMAIAYLIVWAWDEHKTFSTLTRSKTENRLVILIDEIEAHLHPSWQRAILPALLQIKNDLDSELNIQLMIATHSPLIIASIENLFNKEKDKLFHLKINNDEISDKKVELEEIDFIKFGKIDNWLTSDIFELKQARSIDAEQAILEAKKIQEEENLKKENIQRISKILVDVLAEDDEFWPRWVYFAEKNGVKL